MSYRESRMRKDVKIGLTVLAGVVALYLALTWAKSMHFFSTSQQKFTIHFDDVSGLKEGDQVMVYGYPSGNVQRIKLVKGGVDVVVGMDKEVELYADATAEVQVKELLGGKQIALRPGEAAEKWPQGQTIPGTTSLDFAGIFSRIGKLTDIVEDIDFDTLLNNINKVVGVLAEIGEEFDTLDMGGMLTNLQNSAQSLDNILSDADRRQLIRKVDNSLSRIDGLASKATTTLESVTQLTDHINAQTMPVADTMLTQVTGMLDDAEEMMVTLRDLMAQMKNPNTIAGRILYDPEMNKEMDFTLDNLNKTLEHLRTKKVYVTMTLGKKQRKFKEQIRGKKNSHDQDNEEKE